MSASSSPTRAPVRARATARLALIVDFPTPPFPDATATTLRTPGIDRFPCAGSFAARTSAGGAPGAVFFFVKNAMSITSRLMHRMIAGRKTPPLDRRQGADFAVEPSTSFDYSLKDDRPPGPTDRARRGADDGVGAPLPDPRVRPRRRDRLPARRHAGNGRLLRRAGRIPRGPRHPPHRPWFPAGAGGDRRAPDAHRAPRADLLLPRRAPDGGAVRAEAVLRPRAGPPGVQPRDHPRRASPRPRARDGGIRLGSPRGGVPRQLRSAAVRSEV